MQEVVLGGDPLIGGAGGSGASDTATVVEPTAPAAAVETPGELPKTIEEYTSALGLDVKDDNPDKDYIMAVAEKAFGKGLDARAVGEVAKELLELNAELEERVSKSILQAAEANSIALRKEYGDSFSKTAVLASNALNKLAAEAGVTLDVFDTPEMRSNPAIFKIFAHVGKMMQESGFVVNGVPLNNVDPQAELNAIYKDPSHKLYKAFYDSSDPMFHEANRRVDELMEQVRKAK